MTGLLIAIGASSACAKKEAVPVESTAIETVVETEDPYSLGNQDVTVEQPTEIVGTLEDGSATLATTPDGETQADFGIYGPLGKEIYDAIAEQWVNWTIDDEPALRATMDEVYQELPTKEDLTLQILSLTRNPNPYHASGSADASQPESQPETQEAVEVTTPKQSTHSTKSAHSSQTTTPKETQPAPAPQPTQPAPDPTPAPQPTQPAANPTAPHGTTPGGMPLTGDPTLDAMLLEDEQNVHQGSVTAPQRDMDGVASGLEWN